MQTRTFESESRDQIVIAVEDWEARRLALEAMIIEWQRLEDNLSRKARTLQIDFAEACQGELPEAQAMRALDSKIAEAQRSLIGRASEIRRMQSSTLTGAIAKVRLGLEVQGRFDWQANARELIEEGIADLRRIAVRAEGSRSASARA